MSDSKAAESGPERAFVPGRMRRLLLAGVVLFLGGSGLVYEYCISTLATHLLGNSIEQFSLIIALMLFAMGIAGMAQRALQNPVRVAELFVLVEVGLALVGGSSAVVLYLAFAWLEHFRLALYSMALLIGFGIGLEIPLLLRINQGWGRELKDNVGDIFSLDYIGALLGALVWAFVLLPLFPLDRISLFLGLANLVAAAITLVALWETVRRRALLVGALAVSTGVLAGLAMAGPELVVDARQRLYADPIRLHEKSPFQDIVITGVGSRFSMYLNGHLQFDSEDEYIYHEMLVHPALMARDEPPETVLVLGGGDGLAVREVLRWPSVRRVLLVDLDPAVTGLARTWPPLVRLNEAALLDQRVDTETPYLDGAIEAGEVRPVFKAGERAHDALARHREQVAQVRVLHLDADTFLREVPGEWDAVIADFPDPQSPDLAKLFSLELYEQLKRRLSPGGVVAVQAGSPYATRRAFWAVHDTLEAAGFSVCSLHAHVPNFGEWGWHIGRVGETPDPEGEPPVPTRYLDADVLRASMVFPRPMDRLPGPPQVSTRLDPRVMRLYVEGEPLKGVTLFPGSAHR